MARVALFFRHGKPHRLAPSSLMVITNFESGVHRTVAHRGFDGAEFTRSLSVQEVELNKLCYRFHMMFYGDWASLIQDEEKLLALNPSIGNTFLNECRAMAADPRYTIKSIIKAKAKPDEAAQLEQDLIAEFEASSDEKAKRPLDDFEKRVIRDTAARMGVTQLDIFGEDFLNE